MKSGIPMNRPNAITTNCLGWKIKEKTETGWCEVNHGVTNQSNEVFDVVSPERKYFQVFCQK